jgi:hypothetical protein
LSNISFNKKDINLKKIDSFLQQSYKMQKKQLQISRQNKSYKSKRLQVRFPFLNAIRDARRSLLKYIYLVLSDIPYNYNCFSPRIIYIYYFSAALVLIYKLLYLLNLPSFNLINIISFINFNNTTIVQ